MSLISSPPNASCMKTEDSPQSTVDSLQVAFVLCGITQNTPERLQGEEVDRELVVLSHYRACALTLFGQKPSIPIFVSLCSHFMTIFFSRGCLNARCGSCHFFPTVTVAAISV